MKGTVDHVKTELMPEVDFTQFKDRGEKEYKGDKEDDATATTTPAATTEETSSSSDDELKWD